MINEQLLKILACPVCKQSLDLRSEKLVCVKCLKMYPVRDGIPVMLVDEAESIEKE